MMLAGFRIFLRSILPKSRGMKGIALCLLLIPLITDLLLIFLQGRVRGNPIFMSGMLVNGYVRYFPFLVLYLLCFFLVSYVYKKIMSKK